MLAALGAVATALTLASSAWAQPALVRVERADSPYQFGFHAFVDRMAVDPAAPVTYQDPATLPDPSTPANTVTCAANSALAALNAAVGPQGWSGTVTSGALTVTTIKGFKAPAPPLGQLQPLWSWVAVVDQKPATPDLCDATVPAGAEALFYPKCTNAARFDCYTGGALYMRIGNGGPYPVDAATVPLHRAPTTVQVITAGTADPIMPTINAQVTTDEGYSASSNDSLKQGLATLAFTNAGPHAIRATQNGFVPARANVCATEGGDGYCGTVIVPPPPFDASQIPSPCDTNGHDGLCGTTDTSGPVTHVTNITNKKVFKKKKGPGKVVGTIETDPNAVKDVKVRLTRVVSKRVLIKPKKKSHSKKKAKKRYKTVKTCTVWDDSTALLESISCKKKGKWFDADLDDLKQNFTYDFAMTLPAGTYTLEVMSHDENGSPDAVTPGRNLLTFTVQ
jgi:hypothetical protein